MMPDTVEYAQDMNERQLLLAVADGDPLAYKRLYDQHCSQVYNLALKLVGNPQDAEDLAQDVFVTFWNEAKKIRGDSKLSTWLYRVTFNKSLNLKRRGGVWGKVRKFFSIEEETDALDNLPAPSQSRPDRQHEIKEAKTTLAELVAELPGRQGEVFLLHKLQGLSYKEIAAELGISMSAVESAMHRAKMGLQEAMLQRHKRERKKSG